MKKYFLFTLIFIIFSFISLDCEETTLKQPEEYNVLDHQLEFEIYEIENTHSENKDVKVVIYYYPLYKQLRIVYESPYDSYSYDDAIVSLKYCLEEFTIKSGYYHYGRYRADEEHSFKRNNKNYTRVTSYVNLWK